MKLIYKDKEYDCVSVEKESNHIIIHTGKHEEGEEVIYHIYGDIDFDAVVLEGGSWAEPDEPGTDERSVWDELDAAYQEGVDSV